MVAIEIVIAVIATPIRVAIEAVPSVATPVTPKDPLHDAFARDVSPVTPNVPEHEAFAREARPVTPNDPEHEAFTREVRPVTPSVPEQVAFARVAAPEIVVAASVLSPVTANVVCIVAAPATESVVCIVAAPPLVRSFVFVLPGPKVTFPVTPNVPVTEQAFVTPREFSVAAPVVVRVADEVNPLTAREVAAAAPRFPRLRTLPVRTIGAETEIVDCKPVVAIVVYVPSVLVVSEIPAPGAKAFIILFASSCVCPVLGETTMIGD